MNPVFVTVEGRVLDFERTKDNADWRTPVVEVKKDEESFHLMAARSAEQQSTPLRVLSGGQGTPARELD